MYIASTGESFSCAKGSFNSTDSTSPIIILAVFGTSTSAILAITCAGCPTILAFNEPSIITTFPTFSVSSLFRKCAPRYLNSFLTSSYIFSGTITACSEAHIIPLSNDFDTKIELTAIFISALSSIIAGTFPGPTPTAGLPEEYADLTIPGPPVANIRSASAMTTLVNSIEGTSTQPISPFGAPALTAASCTTLAASIVQFLALGWGEKIIPFLVFSAIRDLNIAVDVGLVVGITADKTPTGSAILVKPNASSFSMTPQVLVSL